MSAESSVLEKLESSMIEIINSVRRVHGEYFIGGLFLGLTKPRMGWALLGLSLSVPTLVILKHPEWLNQFKNEKIETILLLVLILIASDIYVLHCFLQTFGLNWLI